MGSSAPRSRGWSKARRCLFLPLFFLFTDHVPAHDTDMPPWVKDSATCSIDVHSEEGFARIELDLTRADTMRLAGEGSWGGQRTLSRTAKRLKGTFFLNGQPPQEVLVLPPSPLYERWDMRWAAPAPPSFELTTTFFQGLRVPAWCRVFMFPSYGDPERSFFFLSDRPFRWPEAENPGPSPSQENVWKKFLSLGYRHILPDGLDHILFVLGLCLAARRWGTLFGQITAFTLAHTLTLGLAAKGWVGLHSGLVEPLIALSIVLVSVENLSPKEPSTRRWRLVFCFGLVHGLGFAGALRETGLPPEAFLQSLLAFNLGVEAGQLTVVALALSILWPLRAKEWYRKRLLIPASVLTAATGLFWAVQRVLGSS